MHVSTTKPSLDHTYVSTAKAETNDSALGHNEQSGLGSLWPDKRQCSTMEFENAVDRYFSMPEIDVIKNNMSTLEDKWHQESLLVLENAVNEQRPVVGYVYALWNPIFPDLLKIGATFRTSNIRARELSGTGIPEPFVVVAELKCRNPFGIEREIHAHYAKVRKYGGKKEFFTLEADDAKQYFETLKLKAMSLPSKIEEIRIKNRLKRVRNWSKVDQKSEKMQSESQQTSESGRGVTMHVSQADSPILHTPPSEHITMGSKVMETDQVKIRVTGPDSDLIKKMEYKELLQSIDELINESEHKINKLSTSIVQFKQHFREFTNEFTKLRASDLAEMMNFITTVVDKAPMLQESMKILVEKRQMTIELDQKALDLKQQHIELEHRASIEAMDIKERQIELGRQASIVEAANRQRKLDMDYSEFRLSELKYDSCKKMKLEDEAL